MKLIPKQEIVEIISRNATTKYDYQFNGNDSKSFELSFYGLDKASDEIIARIKELQFDDEDSRPDVDPNLIKIAELEAKLTIYESVVNGAGVRLAIPRDRPEMGFVKREEGMSGE